MGLAPEGIYEERCIAIGIETTMKGDDYVNADFEFTGSDGQPHTVEWRGWLTEKTEKRTLESLRLMGWDGDDIYDGLDSAMRNKVKIDVRHEEYKGKKTARVSFINGLDLDPAAKEKKRAETRARLKTKAKAIPVPPPQEEDDLPF